MSHQTVRRVVRLISRFDAPDLSERLIRSTVFIWSHNEPAARSSTLVSKVYPNAVQRLMPSHGHMSMLIYHTEAYAVLLLNLAGVPASDK